MGVLSLTVERVESNQKHAEELNKLRFDNLDKTTATLSADIKGWMTRMEGIFTGDLQTAAARDLKAAKEQAQRDGAVVMAEWTTWRKGQEARLDVLEDAAERRGGVMDTLRGAKGLVLMVMAIISPLIAAIGIIVTRP